MSMEHRESPPERRQDSAAEAEQLQAIRREHIVAQYRRDHPVFNEYVMKHGLQSSDAYELLADVSRDPKTGVQRSDLLEYRLKYEIHESINTAKKFSVAVFDIDNFKQINSELTHLGADDVLHQVAEHIRGQDELLVGDDKSVVRWGGEEFVVVLSGVSQEQARQIAEHIRQRIAEALTNVRPNGQPVTVSGGIAEYDPSRHADWKAILQEADEQVLLAKTAGKNVVFPPNEEQPAA